MGKPFVIPRELIQRGASWTPAYTLAMNSAVLDLSPSSVSVVLNMKNRATGDTESRSTENVGETLFPDGTGADGRIQFLFSAAETEALALGIWDIEIIYNDTATEPDMSIVHSRGIAEVEVQKAI